MDAHGSRRTGGVFAVLGPFSVALCCAGLSLCWGGRICEDRRMGSQHRHSSASDDTRHSDDQLDPGDLAFHIGRDEIVIRNRYETLSIVNDTLIGLLFVVGSILFLWESTTLAATWLFIIGSVEFLLRPVIRLTRRIHLKRIGSAPDRTDHGGDF
ncbi:hypothetical protein GCM10027591_17600 [Zhihengliuella somnathii]